MPFGEISNRPATAAELARLSVRPWLQNRTSMSQSSQCAMSFMMADPWPQKCQRLWARVVSGDHARTVRPTLRVLVHCWGWRLALGSRPSAVREVPDDRHDSLQPWSLSSRHFTQSERLALAGCRNLTREACILELCWLFYAPSDPNETMASLPSGLGCPKLGIFVSVSLVAGV